MPQQSMTATGEGGQGEVSITWMEDRMCVIIGDVALSGMIMEDGSLDSDFINQHVKIWPMRLTAGNNTRR